MKKTYIKPYTEKVNVNLIGTVLEEEPNPTGAGYSVETNEVGAKESTLVEEEEALPTQPNLWNDDEE